MPEARTYIRTFEDELDWKLLDQLHAVVTQISNFCFETKKFCVTTEFVVLAFVSKLTTDKIDDAFFVIGLVIALLFWLVDAVGYYYQVKIRGTMEAIRVRLATRNAVGVLGAEGIPVIAAARVGRSQTRRTVDAFANNSMWLYVILIVLDLLAWFLFAIGVIA
jgi:hypothetical protein